MSPASPARAERAALTAVQLGALAVVLAALPYRAFELDRFFVAKELVLHVAAAAAATLLIARAARPAAGGGVRLALTDWALAGFTLLGAVSAVAATNRWLAVRALGVTLSAAAIFWSARALARAGLGRPLLGALAAAVTAGAATSLLQAYGVESEYFSINRAPGGTFGNRNFVAHLGAIGFPLLVLATLTARRPAGAVLGALSAALVAAMLFLTRSRAAWLAVAAGALPLAWAVWRARELTLDARLRGRRRLVVAASGVGVVAALALPNALNWRSDSPYLDSVKGVVDYRQGSGKGRLVQYDNTLRMALDNPVLGVGPGNWAVWYPRYATRRDPSLGDDGMTANPWPSSDWAAFAAERGLVATTLLALALLGVGVRAWLALRAARSAEELVAPAALASALLATLVVGAFDAALLLAPPALVAWGAFGALWPERAPLRRAAGAVRPLLSDAGRRRLAGFAALAGLLLVVRSASQAIAMGIVNDDAERGALERAALADPGSYRIQLWLARGDARRGRCRDVRAHAGRALALFPSAREPRQLLARCGITVAPNPPQR